MAKARFLYFCAEDNGKCGMTVNKTPTHTDPPGETAAMRHDYCGLHGWKCDRHGNGVKVSRKMNKKETQ